MGIIPCKAEAETVHHISTNVVLQGHYTRGWLLAPIQICLWHRCWYALRNQIPGTVQEQDRNCLLRNSFYGGKGGTGIFREPSKEIPKLVEEVSNQLMHTDMSAFHWNCTSFSFYNFEPFLFTLVLPTIFFFCNDSTVLSIFLSNFNGRYHILITELFLLIQMRAWPPFLFKKNFYHFGISATVEKSEASHLTLPASILLRILLLCKDMSVKYFIINTSTEEAKM